jgi:hypothetical protein
MSYLKCQTTLQYVRNGAHCPSCLLQINEAKLAHIYDYCLIWQAYRNVRFQIFWSYVCFWGRNINNWDAVSFTSPHRFFLRWYICLPMCVCRGRPVITRTLWACSYGCGVDWVRYYLLVVRFITTLKHVSLYFNRGILQTINNQSALLRRVKCYWVHFKTSHKI